MHEPQIDFKAFEDKYGFSEEIQELLSHLTEIDQDIIRLKHGAGYKDQEVAQILGLTLSNVKKRYQRAKNKLIELQLEKEKEKEVQEDEL